MGWVEKERQGVDDVCVPLGRGPKREKKRSQQISLFKAGDGTWKMDLNSNKRSVDAASAYLFL